MSESEGQPEETDGGEMMIEGMLFLHLDVSAHPSRFISNN